MALFIMLDPYQKNIGLGFLSSTSAMYLTYNKIQLSNLKLFNQAYLN